MYQHIDTSIFSFINTYNHVQQVEVGEEVEVVTGEETGGHPVGAVSVMPIKRGNVPEAVLVAFLIKKLHITNNGMKVQ
jgi:hypothetical protein